MKIKVILFIFIFCAPVFAKSNDFLQTLDSINAIIQQKITDTTNNTSPVPPTIYNINYKHGKINTKINTSITDSILFKNIQQINYINFNDILTEKIPATPLFTGIKGNSEYFSVLGSLPNENALMLNGVEVNDLYGVTDFNQISPEFMQTAEILFGSNSVIKKGKTGATINIQVPLFNTKQPYSRIWFVQGDNKLIGVDGTFSQNFLPNWNITAGFRRLSANSLYPNSFFDSWNARIAVRYNINNRDAISLLYHFSNYLTGDFGGIKFENYGTDNLLSSNFTNLQNRQYNSNVILTYSKNTADTTFCFNSNLFFNHNENNILFKTEALLLEVDSAGKSITDNYKYGLNIDAKYILNENLNINFGGEVAYKNIPQSIINTAFSGFDYNIFGKGSLLLLSIFDLSIGGRIGSEFGVNVWSGGGNITANINDNIGLYLDASLTQTTPSLIFNLKNEKHQLYIAGTKLKFNFENKFIKTIKSNLNIFYRNINEPILLLWTPEIYSFTPQYSDITEQNIYGIDLNFEVSFLKNINLKINFQDNIYNNIVDNKTAQYNNLLLKTSLQYTYIKGINHIGGGIEAMLLLNEQKLYYNPLFKNYALTNIDKGLENNGLSVFIAAKLGNCFLRGSFNNILGIDYSFLAYYPMPKQEVRLSLTFMFPSGEEKKVNY